MAQRANGNARPCGYVDRRSGGVRPNAAARDLPKWMSLVPHGTALPSAAVHRCRRTGHRTKGRAQMFRTTVLMSVLKRLTSFRGRAGRGDFWAVFLLTTAVTVILLLHPASVVSTGAIQVKRFLLAIFLIQVTSPVILAAYTSRQTSTDLRLVQLRGPFHLLVPLISIADLGRRPVIILVRSWR